MDVNEVIKDINYICLLIAIFIFLVIKYLKYLNSKERLKLKKSESIFNSVNSGSPHSI
jgi:large-conductance mechanosensitive channel